MAEEFIAELRAIVGARHVLTGEDMTPYLKEWRDLFHGKAACVVRPASTAEVSAIMKLCDQHNVPVVPQGGNTGLVGGQIPIAEGREIILSLTRMSALRAIDPLSDTMVVEAGMTLKTAQEAAESAGRLFPLSLASEGSCTIGGNLGSNAGGTAVLAYGNTRDLCLGLEVVLADGRIWNGLTTLRKDNTGYDLKNLFIGSEGTLGIITAAVLKLFPSPKSRATGFVAVPSPDAALKLLGLAREMTGGMVTTFELMPRIGIDFVVKHGQGARDPLAEPSPWYVLVELSSQAETGITDTLEAVLAAAFERELATDAVIAASLDQAQGLWRLRELLSEVQGREGGSIKQDVSVPVADVPAFLTRGIAAVEALIPGCRPVPFGHMGDGNIHFNISQPVGADKAAFLKRWHDVDDVIHAILHQMHGSISAEHGIGRLKRDLLPTVKDPVGLDLMRSLKATLDPKGLMNPGAVL
ncbi:MAG: FAD-binding oxidoreductase [Bosea sp. (in: a-proteobacteria)]